MNARERILARDVLDAMAQIRGSGWVTAGDVVRQLHGKDGRRVAGMLRRLARSSYVERADLRGTRASCRVLEYRITPHGLRHATELREREPRLTDIDGKPWRHRSTVRVPYRQRHKR